MHSRLVKIGTLCAAIALACLLLADPVAAQCVMCRASLQGNGAFARNLNLGVLVLLVPPVSIFCAVFFIAFRHRK